VLPEHACIFLVDTNSILNDHGLSIMSDKCYRLEDITILAQYRDCGEVAMYQIVDGSQTITAKGELICLRAHPIFAPMIT